jgi:maleylacetate reductase
MLPHVVAFNAPAAQSAMQRLARAVGNNDVSAGLTALNRAIGISCSLGDLGFRKQDIDRAAEEITATPYPNPRPAARDDVRAILMAAMQSS